MDNYEFLLSGLTDLLSDVSKLRDLNFDTSQSDKLPETQAFHKGRSCAYGIVADRLSELLDGLKATDKD